MEVEYKTEVTGVATLMFKKTESTLQLIGIPSKIWKVTS